MRSSSGPNNVKSHFNNLKNILVTSHSGGLTTALTVVLTIRRLHLFPESIGIRHDQPTYHPRCCHKYNNPSGFYAWMELRVFEEVEQESNNQAEFEALIARMLLEKGISVTEVVIYDEFQAKRPLMARYLEFLKTLAKVFDVFKLVYAPLEENCRADLLS
ncbi:hypothetical protein V8G54_002627 [Vigna mungo]|uniref:Uncharacterized protein n=1 Tax=Vigna mungo TaxID=3915 RepID=A0AAQ3PCJ4_VIGMU